jgi:mannose-1-phosphate guanylyltransferase
MTMLDVHFLILAGGSGTRFWPASRSTLPKQLLPLSGPSPMIRETMARVLPLVGGPEQVLIAGGRATEAATRAALPEVPAANFLIEPAARNTAPCIAWAAEVVGRARPDALLVVLPSDHHVADPDEFRRVLSVAIGAAREGHIVTIGIRPTRPDTGFGYIELAASPSGAQGPSPFTKGASGPTPVLRFVEKPNRAVAETFLAGGRHVWNAGMFIFRARDMMAAVRRHLPDAATLLDAFVDVPDSARALEESFPKMPSVSIDVGIMEKLGGEERGLLVVPGDFGWSDVGSWQAAWELAEKTADDNTQVPALVAVDARRNHVVATSRKKVVALLGVEGLAVVETEDALLVMPLDRAQDVRAIVDALKADRPELV